MDRFAINFVFEGKEYQEEVTEPVPNEFHINLRAESLKKRFGTNQVFTKHERGYLKFRFEPPALSEDWAFKNLLAAAIQKYLNSGFALPDNSL